MNRSFRLCLIATGLVLLTVQAQAQRSALLKEFEDAFVDLSDNVRPSVVEISAQGPISQEDLQRLEEFRRFFPDQDGEEGSEHPRLPERGPRSTASGFFVDVQGHIVTNNHVVKGSDEFEVELWDGTKRPATVVGQDPDSDIAVLKIDPAGLAIKPVKLGVSGNLRVGQFAIAMGSPSGLTGSFSYGHVTGLGRESLELPEDLRFQEFIQTDAGINLGNSGGPLCNIDGEVIGINVAIVYRANSIGFAIPVDRVRDVVPQLIENGRVIRGWLGVRVRDIADAAALDNQEIPDFVDAHNLPDAQGSLIQMLTPGGPAERGKLEPDDVVRRINGVTIHRSTDLINTISGIKPGDNADIQVWRRGKPLDISVEVGEFPGRSGALWGRAYLGMYLDELRVRPEFLERAGLEKAPSDFYIVDVDPGSAAAEAGIHAGDIVTEVAYQEVESREQFFAALRAEAKPGKTILMQVWDLNNDEEPRKVYVKIPDDFTLE